MHNRLYTRSKTKNLPPPPPADKARPHSNSVGSISQKKPEPCASRSDRVRVRVGIRVVLVLCQTSFHSYWWLLRYGIGKIAKNWKSVKQREVLPFLRSGHIYPLINVHHISAHTYMLTEEEWTELMADKKAKIAPKTFKWVTCRVSKAHEWGLTNYTVSFAAVLGTTRIHR